MPPGIGYTNPILDTNLGYVNPLDSDWVGGNNQSGTTDNLGNWEGLYESLLSKYPILGMDPSTFMGPTGAAGAPGAPGLAGPAGGIGAMGPRGLPGASAEFNVPGFYNDLLEKYPILGMDPSTFMGPAGEAGSPGAPGAPGASAEFNVQGLYNDLLGKYPILGMDPSTFMGPAGEAGGIGPRGFPGEEGAPGASAEFNVQGLYNDLLEKYPILGMDPSVFTGPAGEAGGIGPRGFPGEEGAPGAPGAAAEFDMEGIINQIVGKYPILGMNLDDFMGPAGAAGAPGIAGAEGGIGPRGFPGDPGAPGAPGAPGMDFEGFLNDPRLLEQFPILGRDPSTFMDFEGFLNDPRLLEQFPILGRDPSTFMGPPGLPGMDFEGFLNDPRLLEKYPILGRDPSTFMGPPGPAGDPGAAGQGIDFEGLLNDPRFLEKYPILGMDPSDFGWGAPGTLDITTNQGGATLLDLLDIEDLSGLFDEGGKLDNKTTIVPGEGAGPAEAPADIDFSAFPDAQLDPIPDNIADIEEPLLNMLLGTAGAQDVLGDRFTKALDLPSPFTKEQGGILEETEGVLARDMKEALENLQNRYSVEGKLGTDVFRTALADKLQQGLLDPLAQARIAFGMERARAAEPMRRGRLQDLSGFNQGIIGNLSNALNQQVGRRAGEIGLQQGIFQQNLDNFYRHIGATQQALAFPQGLEDEGLRLFLGSQGASLTPGQALGGAQSGLSSLINQPQGDNRYYQLATLLDMFKQPEKKT